MPSAAATRSFGFGIIAVAIFAAFAVGFWLLLILIPLLPIVITLAVIRAKLKRGQRTAEGRAVCDQVEGFKTYLATAEADQLKFEEGEDIFSKYLPWAIIFELADRWAKICGDLVAMGRLPNATPYWYIGNYQMAAFNTASLRGGHLMRASGPFVGPWRFSVVEAGGSGAGGERQPERRKRWRQSASDPGRRGAYALWLELAAYNRSQGTRPPDGMGPRRKRCPVVSERDLLVPQPACIVTPERRQRRNRMSARGRLRRWSDQQVEVRSGGQGGSPAVCQGGLNEAFTGLVRSPTRSPRRRSFSRPRPALGRGPNPAAGGAVCRLGALLGVLRLAFSWVWSSPCPTRTTRPEEAASSISS